MRKTSQGRQTYTCVSDSAASLYQRAVFTMQERWADDEQQHISVTSRVRNDSSKQQLVWLLCSKLISPHKYDAHRNWGVMSTHPPEPKSGCWGGGGFETAGSDAEQLHR